MSDLVNNDFWAQKADLSAYKFTTQNNPQAISPYAVSTPVPNTGGTRGAAPLSGFLDFLGGGSVGALVPSSSASADSQGFSSASGYVSQGSKVTGDKVFNLNSAEGALEKGFFIGAGIVAMIIIILVAKS